MRLQQKKAKNGRIRMCEEQEKQEECLHSYEYLWNEE